MNPPSVVVLGAAGQLGQTIQSDWSQLESVSGFSLHSFRRSELDITNATEIESKLSPLSPAVLINAAGYTAVDKAESEQALALSINRDGPQELAAWAAKQNCRLIHLSTDFVFDGRSSTPYTPDDRTSPVNHYGASKLAGEQAIREIYAKGSIILRTSWLYSRYRSNFVTTMLALMATKERLGIVTDQIGTPTSTHTLAQLIASIIASDVQCGIFHWSDAGVASWYDFAVAIQEEALDAGLISKAIPIDPIGSRQYPTSAARPAYSVLDKTLSYEQFTGTPSHWRTQLRRVIHELTAGK